MTHQSSKMPPKKKKTATRATPKPSKSNVTKNNKVSTFWTTSLLARNADTIAQSSATAPTHNKTFPFLQLPLEVRRMIYRFALDAPELEIGERRALRRDSVANRTTVSLWSTLPSTTSPSCDFPNRSEPRFRSLVP